MEVWDPTSVGEENEAFFVRVWKPLPSRRVLKTLRESPKRTISASSGLGPLQIVSEPDTGRCANKEAEPRRGVDMRRCACKDAGPWRGMDRGVSHWLEKGTSVSENIGSRRGWIVRSHIGWGGEQSIIYNVWTPFPSRYILKTLRGSPKEKAQRGQYLLTVGLGRYRRPRSSVDKEEE